MAKNIYSGGNYGSNPYQFNNGGYFTNYQNNPYNYTPFPGNPMPQGQPFTNQYNTQYNTQYQQPNNPQPQQYVQTEAPTSPTFIAYVNGVEGAKAYIMMPNNCGMLIDCDSPKVFIKTSNAQGQSTIKPYKLIEDNEQPQTTQTVICTVSREEFDKIRLDLDELRQMVQPRRREANEDEF